MGKPAKVLLGAATAWPIAYLALFTGTLLDVLRAGLVAPPELVEGTPASLAATFALHLGTLVLVVALGGFYARDAARSARVPEDRRIPWLVATVVGGFLAQLPYWYLYVWRDAEPLATTTVGPRPSVQ